MRAAATQVTGGILVSAMVAALWAAVSGNSYWHSLALSLAVVAALLPAFQGISTTADVGVAAWIGQMRGRPGDRDSDGLTPIGVLIFVSLPLGLLAAAVGMYF